MTETVVTFVTFISSISELFTGIENRYASASLFVILELVPLRGESEFGPRHQNEIQWYLFGVFFNFSDEHPCHFYRGF